MMKDLKTVLNNLDKETKTKIIIDLALKGKSLKDIAPTANILLEMIQFFSSKVQENFDYLGIEFAHDKYLDEIARIQGCTREKGETDEEFRGRLIKLMKWTPIKREWPAKRGRYLVTYREWSNGEYLPEYDNTYVRILRYDEAVFKFPKCIDQEAEADINREVLAWMHLPSPYEKEEKGHAKFIG